MNSVLIVEDKDLHSALMPRQTAVMETLFAFKYLRKYDVGSTNAILQYTKFNGRSL